MIGQRYPYTDIHELNLDWILRRMKELEIDFDEFKVVNTITFSGAWDITKQYPAWTIVSDNNIGYVSIQPVPAGVLLTNGDYWREVIDYTSQIAGLQSRVIVLENDMAQAQTDIINIKKSEHTVINVVEYGIDNTGVNPVSTDLNTLIDNNPRATFYFENGTYLIDAPIIVNHSCEIIMDSKAIMKASGAITSVFVLDNDGQREDYTDVFGIKKIIMQGGIIECDNNADTGIECNCTYKSHIVDVKIKNFTTNGIKVNNAGGAALLVDNVLIYGTGASGSYGIYDMGNDNLYEYVTVVDCQTGFYTSDAKLYSCTAWISLAAYYTGSVAFKDRSRTCYTDCTADTVETGWLGETNAHSFITNGAVINNDGVVTPSSNTKIFGASVSYFFYENLVCLLSAGTFAAYPQNVSGINFIGATNYTNQPKLKDFNQIVVPTQSSVNISAAVVNTLLDNVNMNGYFESGAITGSPSGWGNIEVIKTTTAIVQRASIAGYATKARVSTDNGSTWSAWT